MCSPIKHLSLYQLSGKNILVVKTIHRCLKTNFPTTQFSLSSPNIIPQAKLTDAVKPCVNILSDKSPSHVVLFNGFRAHLENSPSHHFNHVRGPHVSGQSAGTMHSANRLPMKIALLWVADRTGEKLQVSQPQPK